MNYKKYLDLQTVPEEYTNITGLYTFIYDKGFLNYAIPYVEEKKDNQIIFTSNFDNFELKTVLTFYDNGLIKRNDSVKNIGKETAIIKKFTSNFIIDIFDAQVYSQFNGWQHENIGNWQPLVTSVNIQNYGTRTCDGATPFAVVKDNQSSIGLVMHVVPNGKWKINISRRQIVSQFDSVVIETGHNDCNFSYELKPNETYNNLEVLFYETDNFVDFSAYKLTSYLNKVLPKRRLPILYNSWLSDFDEINADNLKKQIDTASYMGIEYFMIDAGWFGEKGGWSSTLGDWEEMPNGWLEGRLKEVSDYAIEKGLKFGLWLEPGRTSKTSNSLKNHPDYYLNQMLLDFANDNAREYILSKTLEVIKKYNVSWLKFDFNVTLGEDVRGTSFNDYANGFKLYVDAIRAQYPDIYITCCGAGGFMCDISSLYWSDSFWPTDNQGPIGGLRIYKDFIKRLPSYSFEKWDVRTFINKIPDVYNRGRKDNVSVNTNNGTWTVLAGLDDSFTFNFLNGGVMGFSTDIASFPQEYKDKFKDFIAKYKTEREFYSSCYTYLLSDTDNLTTIEYADDNFNTVKVQAFTQCYYQDKLTVYPKVDASAYYDYNGEVMLGADISKYGVKFTGVKDFDCKTLTLIKK